MGKSLEEMCRLVTGHGAWHIGDMHVSDGPHGIRAQDDGAKNNDSYEATCFPTASGAACSWNTELIGEMGKGLAQEAKALGVSVVLGKTLFLQGNWRLLILWQCRRVEWVHH